MTIAKKLAKQLRVLQAVAHPVRLKILIALFISDVMKWGPEHEKRDARSKRG